MSRRVFLVGYMGSGKTSSGKQLAKELGLNFRDLDKEIAKETSLTPTQWIDQKGELAFRKQERNSLLSLLKEEDLLLSTGGGTPCYYSNMDDMLGAGTCIYLEATPKLLTDRLANSKEKRPLIAHLNDEELMEFVAKHLFERRAFYLKSQLKVSAANPQPSLWAEEVQKFWNQDK